VIWRVDALVLSFFFFFQKFRFLHHSGPSHGIGPVKHCVFFDENCPTGLI
jgi:hypothetical protein